MKYITGQFALNLPCSLETCGDWHTSALNWDKMKLEESDISFFGNYGIETNRTLPMFEGIFNVANHIRALLDMLYNEQYALAQGMKKDYICVSQYNHEIFKKVYEMRSLKQWNNIRSFMEKEYKLDWINFERMCDKQLCGKMNINK